MRLGRVSLLAITVTVLLIGTVIVLVVAGWTPLAADTVNNRATEAGQAVAPWMGFTPFTPLVASIGLVVVASVLLLALLWVLTARFVPPATGRLPEMIAARRPDAEPRSLIELIEDLVRVQRHQHRELLDRIEALESGRAAPRSEPVIIARPRPADMDDHDSVPEPASPLRRPVFEAAPPPTAAALAANARAAIEALEREYRDLLANPGASAFREFFQSCGALAVQLSGERLVGSQGAGALLHAVPIGGSTHALLPGYDLVSDFDTVYFAQRAMPEEAKLAFDFDIDGSRTLKLGAAGRATLTDDGSYRIDGRGRLGGLAA